MRPKVVHAGQRGGDGGVFIEGEGYAGNKQEDDGKATEDEQPRQATHAPEAFAQALEPGAEAAASGAAWLGWAGCRRVKAPHQRRPGVENGGWRLHRNSACCAGNVPIPGSSWPRHYSGRAAISAVQVPFIRVAPPWFLTSKAMTIEPPPMRGRAF